MRKTPQLEGDPKFTCPFNLNTMITVDALVSWALLLGIRHRDCFSGAFDSPDLFKPFPPDRTKHTHPQWLFSIVQVALCKQQGSVHHPG